MIKNNDVGITFSTFPAIDYVTFTHILDLPM